MGEPMTKQGVLPDSFSQPFWDAANEERLVIQNCRACNRLQHPPAEVMPRVRRQRSPSSGSPSAGVARSTITASCMTVPCGCSKRNQPFNVAVIMLEDDPGIQMFSHLPGTPVDDVPLGAAVEVIFEPTANGQLVPEWRVIAG